MAPAPDLEAIHHAKPDDYIAHLRLINFTLLVASIGLMIAALQPTNSQYDQAMRDLTEITLIAQEPISHLFIRHARELSSRELSTGATSKRTLYVPFFGYPASGIAHLSRDLLYLFPRKVRAKLPELRQPTEPKLKDEKPLLEEGGDVMKTLGDFSALWTYFDDTKPFLLLPGEVDPVARVALDGGYSITANVKPAPVYKTRPNQRRLATFDLTGLRELSGELTSTGDDVSCATIDPIRDRIYVVRHGKIPGTAAAPEKTGSFIQAIDLPLIAGRIPTGTEFTGGGKYAVLEESQDVEQLAVSPNGESLATLAHTSNGVLIDVWHLPDFSGRRSIQCPHDIYYHNVLAFSSDGEQLLFTSPVLSETAKSRPNSLHLANVKELKPFVNVKDLKVVAGFDPPPMQYIAAAFQPSGPVIVVAVRKEGGNEINIATMHRQTGEMATPIASYKEFVSGIVFLSSGSSFAVASSDGSVRIYPTSTNGESKELLVNASPVTALAISRTGDRLAAASADLRLHMWNLTQMMQIGVLEYGAVAQWLGFSSDGTKLACYASPLSEIDINRVWLEDTDDNTRVTMHATGKSGEKITIVPASIDIRVPMQIKRVQFDLRSSLSKRADEKGLIWLPQASFDRAFPALASLTRNIQSTKFSDLFIHLQEEKNRAGEKLEIIGLKIPVASLNIAGFVILLGLQLYLWIHLHAFRAMNIPVTSLALVPWIGLYPDRASRVCYFMSATVLVVASCFVLLFAAWAFSGFWLRAVSIFCLLVSFCLAGLTAFEIVSFWKWVHEGSIGLNAIKSQAFSHEDISGVAYHLWQAAGSPVGQAEEYWFAAIKHLEQAKDTL
jgi:WD40 repeat protein